METFKSFEEGLYAVNGSSFNEIALKLFHFQARHNPIYAEYLGHLGSRAQEIGHFYEIPFLPISFFKAYPIKTGAWNEEVVFKSSGTTGSTASHHYVRSLSFYLQNAVQSFTYFFGPTNQYHVLALLPSYLEREGSSLIAMVDHFIRESGSGHSGFFLHNQDELIRSLLQLRNDQRKVILWGVSFALTDLAEKFEVDLSHCIILETGGMKGKRKEITREELHGLLGRRFNASKIFSEFGMTELLSQAYSTGEGIFRCPPWMRVILRDPEDPLDFARQPHVGGINIIDLANFSSCAFIETRDLGRVGQNGSFEVIGRLDNSDIRGCNLQVE